MVVARNPESWIIMKNIRREKGGSTPPPKKYGTFGGGGFRKIVSYNAEGS